MSYQTFTNELHQLWSYWTTVDEIFTRYCPTRAILAWPLHVWCPCCPTPRTCRGGTSALSEALEGCMAHHHRMAAGLEANREWPSSIRPHRPCPRPSSYIADISWVGCRRFQSLSGAARTSAAPQSANLLGPMGISFFFGPKHLTVRRMEMPLGRVVGGPAWTRTIFFTNWIFPVTQ